VTPQRGNRLTAILVAAVAACATAGFGAMMTDLGPWYMALRKPPWQPPDWAFGPAWTLIFALAGAAGYYAWRAVPNLRRWGLIVGLFAANGVLNVLWSALFFHLHHPDWALAEVGALWLSILVLIIALAPVSRLAGALMVPYLLWVSFAGVLNFTVVRLNAPFGAG
jgi:tryptophan-rich sensory protein